MDTIIFCPRPSLSCPIPVCLPSPIPLTACTDEVQFVIHAKNGLGPCDSTFPTDHAESGVVGVGSCGAPVGCTGLFYPPGWVKWCCGNDTSGCGYDGARYLPEGCCTGGNWEYTWTVGGTSGVIPFDIEINLYSKDGGKISTICVIPVQPTDPGPPLTGTGTFSHGTNGVCGDSFFIVAEGAKADQSVGNTAIASISLCNTDRCSVGCSSTF